MPMAEQVIPVQFNAGINTAADPKLVQQGMLAIENGLFDRDGAINKRNGVFPFKEDVSGRNLGQLNGKPVVLGASLFTSDGEAGAISDLNGIIGEDKPVGTITRDGTTTTIEIPDDTNGDWYINGVENTPIAYTETGDGNWEYETSINSLTDSAYVHGGIAVYLNRQTAYFFYLWKFSGYAFNVDKLENNDYSIIHSTYNISGDPNNNAIKMKVSYVAITHMLTFKFQQVTDNDWVTVSVDESSFTPDKVGLFCRNKDEGDHYPESLARFTTVTGTGIKKSLVDNMHEIGSIANMDVISTPILSTSDSDIYIADICSIGDIETIFYVVSLEAGGDARLVVQNKQSGIVIDSLDVSGAGAGIAVKCVPLATKIWFFYRYHIGGGEMRHCYGTIDSITGEISTPIELTSWPTSAIGNMLDASPVGSPIANIAMIYTSFSTNQLVVGRFNDDGVAYQTFAMSGGTPSRLHVCDFNGSACVLFGVYDGVDNNYDIYAVAYDLDTMTETVSETLLLEQDVDQLITKFCGVETSGTTLKVYCGIKLYGNWNTIHGIKQNTLTNNAGTGVAGTPAWFKYHVDVIGRPLVVEGTYHYLPVIFVGKPEGSGAYNYKTIIQRSMFILDQDGIVNGKTLIDIHGVLTIDNFNGFLPYTQKDDDVLWTFAASKMSAVNMEMVCKVTVEIIINGNMRLANCGPYMIVPGSIPQLFDGRVIIESGFLYFPERVVATAGGSGGTIDTGTYGVVATYEWCDSQGYLHVSAPSPVVSVDVSSGQMLSYSVPTLTLTEKESVAIVIYRTEHNGSLYYERARLENDTTAYEVTFTDDDMSDDELRDNRMLYTTGNVIEDVQPYSFRIHATHQSRHFYVPRDNEDRLIRYTKKYLDGENLRYNEVLSISIDQAGGAMMAIASFLDRLLVFKENTIIALTGDGLNDVGVGQGFSDPMTVSSSVGCTSQKLITSIPDGLVFMSYDGIKLIDNALNIHHIGKFVQYYTKTYEYISCCTVPHLSSAIFVSTNGPALVYNYVAQKWTTFTNFNAYDCICVDDIFYIKTSDQLLVEYPGEFSDGEDPIVLLVETGWFSFSGVGGRTRLREFAILGQNIDVHTLHILTGYNFDPAWTDHQEFDATALSEFDYGSYYGDGLASSYVNQAYLLRCKTSKQKVNSFRIKIYDEGNGEGYSIAGLTLRVGIKEGVAKSGVNRKPSIYGG